MKTMYRIMVFSLISFLTLAITCVTPPAPPSTSPQDSVIIVYDTVVVTYDTLIINYDTVVVNFDTLIIRYDTIVVNVEKISYDTIRVKLEYCPDDYDTTAREAKYTGLEYVGKWTKPSGTTQIGRYSNKPTDTLRYRYYGHNIEIFTERDPGHKGYKVFIDKKYIETVNTYNQVFILNEKTFEYKTSSGNHVIELVPDNGYFVFNKLIVTFYHDPSK